MTEYSVLAVFIPVIVGASVWKLTVIKIGPRRAPSSGSILRYARRSRSQPRRPEAALLIVNCRSNGAGDGGYTCGVG
ncbi:MAG: hypothetical protein IPJ19_18735 [Planctomycetes bacterium]|nr:hypothetical protein [Planctomycetota bacterium]